MDRLESARFRTGRISDHLADGRRGDRYGVVSSFAAHLESTRRVEEQLPALAGAVAATFKVPFVRVEVVTPAGGTVAAGHGDPDEDARRQLEGRPFVDTFAADILARNPQDNSRVLIENQLERSDHSHFQTV